MLKILLKMISLFLAIFVLQSLALIPAGIISKIMISVGVNSKFMLDFGTFFISICIQEISIISAILIMCIFIENKTTEDIGLTSIKLNLKNLTLGFIMGVISMSFIFLAVLTVGYGRTEYVGLNSTLIIQHILSFIMYILVGFAEELMCRGYIMYILKSKMNIFFASVISAAIFSILHSANPNIGIIAYMNIFIVGLLFSYMLIKSSNLWLPIGFHISWNYFQGDIFGFGVSGIEQSGIYNTTVQPNILNGGYFGPEGGLIVTFTLCICFIFIYFRYKDKSFNL